MKYLEEENFSIGNFEGSLDFLWHLIQKDEIDIFEVTIRLITEQYLERLEELTEPNLDAGAEFMKVTASLICLKSKGLLPKHEQELSLTEEEMDPRFEVIHQLVDYCRFKDAAKELTKRELHQSAFYARGGDPSFETKKTLGIEHLTLEDLAGLFQQILTKAPAQEGKIHEELWSVSDKIRVIRETLMSDQQKILFGVLFSLDKTRGEWIVTFLAILELMKMGEVHVVKDLASNEIVIITREKKDG